MNEKAERVREITRQSRTCAFTYGELELYRLAKGLADQLARAEKVVEAAKAFESGLSEYCDGSERDALRTAIKEYEEGL